MNGFCGFIEEIPENSLAHSTEDIVRRWTSYEHISDIESVSSLTLDFPSFQNWEQ